MSWTEGVRGDFLPNLKIEDDAFAFVTFEEEPRAVDFGKKTNRQGKEVDDKRFCANVIYHGGTGATATQGKVTFSPIVGDKYALWLPVSLRTAFVDVMEWKEKTPPRLIGTHWKIYRSEKKQGPNRLYAAEKLDSIPEEFIDEEAIKDVVNILMQLKQVDKNSFKVFCDGKKLDSTQVINYLKKRDRIVEEATAIIYKG